ncbi:hypothetical protein QTA58_03425 [Neorhizobium sp. CSC1952]|uniref:hypothetical protein n=1 Tax=Neorhizobium sp. CSC1952 TaxID=2978974 RepID=UPI0025A6898D|nr:hypothetical protein [Rhizobium sp. CSC1952]WJR67828.1 hypothetical protein QTA58_03425 [Rhizobium sp. CSC1952]
MISFTGISIGSLPYEDYLAPLVALVAVMTALAAIVGGVYLLGRYVRLAIRQWTALSMRPFYEAIGRAWDALVLFLRGQLDYPELPNGRARWRPVDVPEAVKAAPCLIFSLLLLGIFTVITMLYGWQGLGSPKLSLGAHAMVLAYLVGIVAFARMLMVRGVKIWHGLR